MIIAGHGRHPSGTTKVEGDHLNARREAFLRSVRTPGMNILRWALWEEGKPKEQIE
jgi:hypothetical protein